jgi:hypothetical protein
MGADAQLKEMLMGFLKDKSVVLGQMSSNLVKLSTVNKGLDRLVELLESDSEVNFRKTALALTKSLQAVSDLTHQNTICLLIYLSGGNFDSDTARLLNKLGFGQEAVRQIFKNKMEGRG